MKLYLLSYVILSLARMGKLSLRGLLSIDERLVGAKL